MRAAVFIACFVGALSGCQGKDAPSTTDSQISNIESRSPSLTIQSGSVMYASQSLVLGQDIKTWSEIIGGRPRGIPDQPAVFIWDDLGLEVLTDWKDPSKVVQLTIYLNLEPQNEVTNLVATKPDGSPLERRSNLRPNKPFSGRLVLDGFVVDAKTRFSDIRAHADPSRRLRCGLRDCSHPGGALNDSTVISLRLTGTRDTERVYELVIGE